MFIPPPRDPRRRARIITGEIIAVGIMIIAAMSVMVGASIMPARQSTMDRTRSEGRNLAVAFAGEVTNILGGVNALGWHIGMDSDDRLEPMCSSPPASAATADGDPKPRKAWRRRAGGYRVR